MLPDLLPATTDSPEETRALGKALSSSLGPGSIVALYGDLGAGKTRLVMGLCEGLGIDPAAVTSPTFSLINEYRGPEHTVYHFDAYRLKRLGEFLALGYEEYFFGDGITVIEWSERIEELLPHDAIRLRMTHAGAQTRRIEELQISTRT